MIENKAITYSLLAHVRNSGTLFKGPIDPFIPLIKRALYKLNTKGILSGKSIKEIHEMSTELYSIDFPLPVLRLILEEIAKEVNVDGQINFQIFKDDAFLLKNFYFEEFEEKIQESKREVETLEKLYLDFHKVNNIDPKDKTTIFDFIDKNKVSMSKYLSNSSHPNGNDYTVEAQFVDFFKKIPDVFDIIRNIYLGSIISSYLEYKTENLKEDVELVFDTNFLISLFDLNTPESTHTCNKLIEVCKNLGYRFTVLNDTIEETKGLIQKKAEYYSSSILSKRINPEDIYNACERRKLNRNDLERIADNLESSISSKGITIITQTEKYKNIAKYSPEYERLKNYRTSHYAALHDAMVLCYIRDKRKIKIKQFEKVNCWFVNNTINHESDESKEVININEFQPEIIRADELLNILWLANPRLTQVLDGNELIDIGLSSIVAFTLNSSLPKASIIKELDENIQKYRGEIITDKDILLISSRISHRQLKNINDLNSLANKNQGQFINKIKEEASKQAIEESERIQKLDSLFQKFEKQISSLDKARQELRTKQTILDSEIENNKNIQSVENQQLLNLTKLLEEEKERNKAIQNEINKAKRSKLIADKIKSWRAWILIPLILSIIIFLIGIIIILYLSNWKFIDSVELIRACNSNIITASIFTVCSFLITGLLVPIFILRFFNNSNIEAFKKTIHIPDDLLDK